MYVGWPLYWITEPTNSSLDIFRCPYSFCFLWDLPDSIEFHLHVAYSPQLGARLNISYTQLNIIGLAGNGKQFFVYARLYFDYFFSAGVTTAPIWGRMVDSQKPRILFLLSFTFLLGGYSGIKYIYDSGLAPGTSTLPALSFYMLVLCIFLTGSGSFGGLCTTLNSTVKSFPDEVVSEWAPPINCNHML